MTRCFAKWRAKRQYLWSLEIESAKSDINAALAARNAQAKRELSNQRSAEATEIEENIKAIDEKLAAGYWECENGHENADFLPSIASGIAVVCKVCFGPCKLVQVSTMTGQEKYESEKEREEAEQVASEKRKQAAKEEKKAVDGEGVAKYHRALAENARQTAEKIKSL